MVSIYQVLGNSFDSWTLITYTSLHKHYQFMTWLYAIWLFWLLQRVRHFIVWIVWKGSMLYVVYVVRVTLSYSTLT